MTEVGVNVKSPSHSDGLCIFDPMQGASVDATGFEPVTFTMST